MSKISEAAEAGVLLLLLGTGPMVAWSALGPHVEPTPDTTHEIPANQAHFDLPPLVLAVPVLDPGLPKNPGGVGEEGHLA